MGRSGLVTCLDALCFCSRLGLEVEKETCGDLFASQGDFGGYTVDSQRDSWIGLGLIVSSDGLVIQHLVRDFAGAQVRGVADGLYSLSRGGDRHAKVRVKRWL